jgi:lactate racemase-like protein
MAYPNLIRLRQRFEQTGLADLQTAVCDELNSLRFDRVVRAGQSVALPVGSRGIANLQQIVRTIVDHFLQLGAKPFIVPAMGSHGGATATGQQAILESYAITETSVGCPIRSSCETVVLGRSPLGFDIHFDRLAAEADHCFIFNRIKSHTSFDGTVQSGLLKMLLIGLGNPTGAKIYHRAIQQYSFDQIIRETAPIVWQNLSLLGGLAIVENAYDETMLVRAVGPDDFESTEQTLLPIASASMPRLPFDRVDLLLVDQIGKNISGTGLDTNVVGRKTNDHRAAVDEWPKITRIAVRDIAEASHGNAIGLGIAEFCRSRALEKVDWAATRANVLSSGRISAAFAPLDYQTDREILDAALKTVGLVEPSESRIVWIANTLDLAELVCSVAYLDEIRQRGDLEIISEPFEMPLDSAGNLPELPSLS